MSGKNGERRTAVVKRWEDQRGFGFLTPDDGSKDVFVHFSGISGDGYRKLSQGQRVEYDVITTAKGPQAVNVSVVG